MTSPTIVYLHGFRSSPASVKATKLGAAVAALPQKVRPTLIIPELTHRPAEAMAAIDDLAAAVDPARLAFIGSSLGGFYAMVAAERHGARAVLLNPALQPDRELRAYVGRQVNLYTGTEFEVTHDDLDDLRALRPQRITDPNRYFLLVQTGDEVLDYRLAVDFFGGARQFVQGGGDHGFQDFTAQIPPILRFCGVSETFFVHCS